MLHIDFDRPEIIIHSNLFHAGMDTQEILPLIVNENNFITDTSVASYFRDPIQFEKPNLDTLTIKMNNQNHKFVKRKYEVSENSKNDFYSNSWDLYDRSYSLSSQLLLKYNEN